MQTGARYASDGYGKLNRERATFTALGYRFLKDKIGWSDLPA
jgi:prolyl oligopeptidase